MLELGEDEILEDTEELGDEEIELLGELEIELLGEGEEDGEELIEELGDELGEDEIECEGEEDGELEIEEDGEEEGLLVLGAKDAMITLLAVDEPMFIVILWEPAGVIAALES